MRVFLSVLILIFSLQSWTKADDIRDFEIESMSIGDSLLDYFNETEIQNSQRYDNTTGFTSNKFFQLRIKKKGQYEEILIGLKTDDKLYKIYSLSGTVKYENNISDCYNKKKEIEEEFKTLFKKAKISRQDKDSHPADKSGKSIVASTYFDLISGDYVSIECYDWTKEMGYWDNLRIGIISKTFGDWLTYEAYK